LALWTAEEFDRQMDEADAKQSLGQAERNAARILASGSVEVEVDRQGRVAIPAFLRDFADLQPETTILVIGAINRVELWNQEGWDRRVKPAEARLVGSPEQPTTAVVAAAP
jgi:MraZ protein